MSSWFLAAALKGLEIAAKALEVPTASLAYRRNMARTAILLARPVKG
ncbi:hypothetical protein [Methylobacterium iners]|nr:hypothetical protein [Methylobacterium iners]